MNLTSQFKLYYKIANLRVLLPTLLFLLTRDDKNCTNKNLKTLGSRTFGIKTSVASFKYLVQI